VKTVKKVKLTLLEWTNEGKRYQGRPKRHRMDNIKLWMIEDYLSVNQSVRNNQLKQWWASGFEKMLWLENMKNCQHH